MFKSVSLHWLDYNYELKLAQAYTKESKACALCQSEKVCIAYAEHFSTLNARSELIGKCRHRRKHLLMNWI